MAELTLFRSVSALLLLTLGISRPTSGQDKELIPPFGLWAAQTSWNHITLVWPAVAGGSRYRISSQDFRRTVDNTARYVAPFKGTDTVQFYLEALDAKGGVLDNKMAFNPVVPLTEDALPGRPDRPASVTAAETADGGVRVTWSPVPGATAYFLGRAVEPEGYRVFCHLCSTSTEFVDRGVTAGAKHTYSVAAITPAGTGQRARSNPVTPSGRKGLAKVELSAVLSSPTAITLTWSPVAGATGYSLRRSRDGGEFVEIAGDLGKPGYVHRISRGKAEVFRFELLPYNAKGPAAQPVRSNSIAIAADPSTELVEADTTTSVPRPVLRQPVRPVPNSSADQTD